MVELKSIRLPADHCSIGQCA